MQKIARRVSALIPRDKRTWLFAALFSVPFAAAQSAGWFTAQGGEFARISGGEAAVRVAVFILLAAGGAAVVAVMLSQMFGRARAPQSASSLRTLPRALAFLERWLHRLLDHPHAWLLIWLVMVVCWLPVCAAFFPGLLTYDPLYEVKWALSDGVVTAFHTLAHSFWLTGMFSVGKMLFGSYEAGMVLYTVSQVLLLSGAFSYCVYALRRLGVPFWVRTCALVWFALFPVHAVLAVTATKDVAFAAFFLLAVLFSLEALQNPTRFFSKWRYPLRLAAVLLLMFAFRKNGIYAFAVAAPFLVAGCTGARGRAALLCGACLLAGVLYFGPIHQAVCTPDTPTVPASGKVEALSVPMQQLARTLVDDGDDVDQDMRQAIANYLPSWQAYNERIVDPLKFGGNTNERIEEDPFGFLGLWATVGAQHVDTYVDAWAAMSYGYWYVDFHFSSYLEGYPYLDCSSVAPDGISDADADAFIFIEQHSVQSLAQVVGAIMRHQPWEAVPVVSWLFSPGLMFWVLAFSAVACLYARRLRLAASLVFPLVYWVSCLLGPTLLIRYAYPFFVIMPLAVAIVCLARENRRDIDNGALKERVVVVCSEVDGTGVHQ